MKRRTLVLALILVASPGLAGARDGGNRGATRECATPVGLDLEFVEGIHVPLPLIAGRTYYVDSLTLRTRVEGIRRDVLSRLRTESTFRSLDWSGLEKERFEWLPNADGTFDFEQFYRNAGWMGGDHRFTLSVRDARGDLVTRPSEIRSTPLWPAPEFEAFATRRFSTLVFGHSIVDPSNPAGAEYSAEAWLQLRNGVPGNRTFVIPTEAARIEIEWSRLPGRIFEVPLNPVTGSEWDYGFRIEVEPSPPADGLSHQPGETITFQVTFTDGCGRPLHEADTLPTYAQYVAGQVESGLEYYNFFPAVVYYKNKNREGVLLASFTGPTHRVRQTHEAVPLALFLEHEVQVAARSREHGFSSQWRMIPPAPVIFGGGEAWTSPVSSALRFSLPTDAHAGAYEFVIKARRLYRGEESLATSRVRVQVGGPVNGEGLPDEVLVANCENCHNGMFDLSRMLHYNGDVQTCTSCHLPLEFETNNLLAYRIHRIHDLSERYTEDRRSCGPCHVRPTREVLDAARWLVCTGCHDPWETHDHQNYAGDLNSCGDYQCHHFNNPDIHDMTQD